MERNLEREGSNDDEAVNANASADDELKVIAATEEDEHWREGDASSCLY